MARCILLHDCPMFGKSYIQKVLCSEGPMFGKFLFRRSYAQMVSYSEGPMFIRSYAQKYLFRRSYAQKVLCSEGPIFRNICLEGSISIRSNVQKVLYSEDPLFRRSYAGTHFDLSASGIKAFLSQFISRFFFSLLNFIIHFFLGYTRVSSKVPTFSELQIPKFPKFAEFGNPKPKFRSSVVMRGVLHCVFLID